MTPQVITLDLNSQYYSLINEFYKVTAVGALLNTSFNVHGKPIVLNLKSALRTFKKVD